MLRNLPLNLPSFSHFDDIFTFLAFGFSSHINFSRSSTLFTLEIPSGEKFSHFGWLDGGGGQSTRLRLSHSRNLSSSLIVERIYDVRRPLKVLPLHRVAHWYIYCKNCYGARTKWRWSHFLLFWIEEAIVVNVYSGRNHDSKQFFLQISAAFWLLALLAPILMICDSPCHCSQSYYYTMLLAGLFTMLLMRHIACPTLSSLKSHDSSSAALSCSLCQSKIQEKNIDRVGPNIAWPLLIATQISLLSCFHLTIDAKSNHLFLVLCQLEILRRITDQITNVSPLRHVFHLMSSITLTKSSISPPLPPLFQQVLSNDWWSFGPSNLSLSLTTLDPVQSDQLHFSIRFRSPTFYWPPDISSFY